MLRARGVDAAGFDPSRQARYDVVVFQKAYAQEHIDHAVRLRRAGTRVVFDICDDHWFQVTASDEHALRSSRLDEMVALADQVTVSTHELARVVPRSCVVVHDALDPVALTASARWARRLLPRSPTRLLWFGNPGTVDPPYGLVDLVHVLPTLNELRRTWDITLTVVTDTKSPMLEVLTRRAALPVTVVKWRYLTFGAIASRHALCLLPAQPNRFTRAKTSNRAVTALRCGLAVVAADLPEYRRLEGSIRIESWEQNLAAYLADPSMARREAQAGGREVEHMFADNVIAPQWMTALNSARDGGS